MTSFFPPRESLVVTSRLGTGNSRTIFFTVHALYHDISRHDESQMEAWKTFMQYLEDLNKQLAWPPA
jgi:hypothetical protein